MLIAILVLSALSLGIQAVFTTFFISVMFLEEKEKKEVRKRTSQQNEDNNHNA